MLLILCFLILMTAVLLLFPAQSLELAALGLHLWFERMLPTLFPFMVLNGLLIGLGLIPLLLKPLLPLAKPLFQTTENGLYCILIGFLSGFPMGAHTISMLYKQNCLSKSEAEYLLAFCNNIGPAYFMSYALPVIYGGNGIPYLRALGGMYLIPLLYGAALRFLTSHKALPMGLGVNAIPPAQTVSLDGIITDSLHGITRLGGSMILFNLFAVLLLPLARYYPLPAAILHCFLEISGGLKRFLELTDALVSPFYTILLLTLLQFGGLSCIAQTYSSLSGTDLSIWKYILHKLILSTLTFFFHIVLMFLRFT